MSAFKRRLMDGFLQSRLYPHIFFFRNPFKFLEFNELVRGMAFKRTDVMLDVGCGIGLQTSLLGKRGKRVIGIDVSEQAIARSQSEQHMVQGRIDVEFRCTRIEEAGFADASFDKIFSICVLEHIPDHERVLRECYRVLKPGGRLAFSVDSLETIRETDLIRKHKERYDVCHYFRADEIRAAFEAAGFRDVQVQSLACSTYAARLFSDGIQKEFEYRYLEAIRLYYMLKWAEWRNRNRAAGVYLLIKCRR